MLTMNDLKEFERRMTSGALEDEFKYAPEERRIEILELLEKIMDVADIADETATRLIFRGSLPPRQSQ